MLSLTKITKTQLLAMVFHMFYTFKQYILLFSVILPHKQMKSYIARSNVLAW